MTGRKAEAGAVDTELSQLSDTMYVPPFHLAVLYLGFGDKSRALEWLEKAVGDRSPELIYITVDPRFDAIRDDPRFLALARKVYPQITEPRP